MNYKETKYLVFDVESVPDSKLIKKVRYPEENFTEAEAVAEYRKYLLEQSGGTSDFIPATFQYPVAICIAKVREDFTLQDIVSLDEPNFRAKDMTRLFWHGIENLYDHASFVTFNGRGFDIPLLELMAYRYGITAKRHFKDKFAGRYRFGTKHIDMQDVLSNYGAIRMNGGLNLLAKVLGKPGKIGTSGSDVYDMFLAGKMQEISDYCMHDVLDTYFVFLRSRVVMGEITAEREAEITAKARKFVEENTGRIPALKEYLDHWTDEPAWP